MVTLKTLLNLLTSHMVCSSPTVPSLLLSFMACNQPVTDLQEILSLTRSESGRLTLVQQDCPLRLSGQLSEAAAACKQHGTIHSDLLQLLRALRNLCAAGPHVCEVLSQQGLPSSTLTLLQSQAALPGTLPIPLQIRNFCRHWYTPTAGVAGGPNLLQAGAQLLANMAAGSPAAAQGIHAVLTPDIGSLIAGAGGDFLCTASRTHELSLDVMDSDGMAAGEALDAFSYLLLRLAAVCPGAALQFCGQPWRSILRAQLVACQQPDLQARRCLPAPVRPGMLNERP